MGWRFFIPESCTHTQIFCAHDAAPSDSCDPNRKTDQQVDSKLGNSNLDFGVTSATFGELRENLQHFTAGRSHIFAALKEQPRSRAATALWTGGFAPLRLIFRLRPLLLARCKK